MGWSGRLYRRVVSRIEHLTSRLAAAGCVAASEEALELASAATRLGVGLEGLVRRRERGEPLAWVTGRATFCGLDIHVLPGVYVPRWQSEPMALAAVEATPEVGTAIDLCTGSGAIAAVLASRRPGATVLAADLDARAVECARLNEVDAYAGDMDRPLSNGTVADVVVASVPYVPTEALHLLPRDVVDYEPALAIDGGPGGTRLLRRAVEAAGRLLKDGGSVFLELGGDQAAVMRVALARAGFDNVDVHTDDDGDDRFISAVKAARRSRHR